MAEEFIYRVADALGIEREVITGSYAVRTIEQVIRERDAFRKALDGAYTPLGKRARKLAVEDWLYDEKSGRTWTVQGVEIDAFGVTLDLTVHRTGKWIRDYRIKGLDTPVAVLTPLVERDGLLVLRKELSAQLLDFVRPEEHAEPQPEVEGAWDVGTVHSCPLLPQPHAAFSACVRYATEHGDTTFVGRASKRPG